MRRLFDLWRRAGPAAHAAVPDAELLRRFAQHADGDAFAALVARHGPLVYGVCRRLLPDPLDVEDAFQATFLVLVRRAGAAAGRPLGPWLHRVAVWTARNLRRRNATRLAATTPMREIAATPPAADDRLDLDAALAALPGKYRVPVILCHLQGWTRRELALHLGCPESTASSLVGRGLAKLRKRLAGRDPAMVLAAAGSAAVPAGLTAAAARAAAIYATSCTAASVSPAVVALTNGVLRMFWVKKLTAAGAAVLAAAAVVLGVGLAADNKPVPPPDPAAAKEREQVEKELNAAKKRVEELEAKRKQLDDAEKNPPGLVITVRPANPPIVITEYTIGGKVVGSVETASVEMVTRFVRRTWADLAGAKRLTLITTPGSSEERCNAVLDALRIVGREPDAVFRQSIKVGSAPALPAQPTPLIPPAADPLAGYSLAVGFFQGFEEYPNPGFEYRKMVVSSRKDGGRYSRYAIPRNDPPPLREPDGGAIDWEDLKPGQAVNLHLAPGNICRVVKVVVPTQAKPDYVIEPPDILLIEVTVRNADPRRVPVEVPLRLTGQYIVRPDGTVGLGTWGPVSVNGLTIGQAAEAVREQIVGRPEFKPLGVPPADLKVNVDVTAFNSKRYYVLGDVPEPKSFPLTGGETVLDALTQAKALAGLDGCKVWVHRKGTAGRPDQTLPVDWKGITQGGVTATNYQLMAGDRVVVERKK